MAASDNKNECSNFTTKKFHSQWNSNIAYFTQWNVQCMYSKTQTRWQFLFLFVFSFVNATSNWPLDCERCIYTFLQCLSYFCLFLEGRANLGLTSLIIYYELWVKEAILLGSKCTCLLQRRKPSQQNCWYFHKHFKLKCALSAQLTFTCPKSTIETLEKGVKYDQSSQGHQNDSNDVILVSLLLTLNIFHTFFCYF